MVHDVTLELQMAFILIPLSSWMMYDYYLFYLHWILTTKTKTLDCTLDLMMNDHLLRITRMLRKVPIDSFNLNVKSLIVYLLTLKHSSSDLIQRIHNNINTIASYLLIFHLSLYCSSPNYLHLTTMYRSLTTKHT